MNGTQTLSRALDILFALAEAGDTLTVSEIAEKVSIPESTTYRLLQTLEQNGIVERRGRSRIALGLRILDLARSLNLQFQRDLLPLALPIMEELTEKVQETSVLFVRTGNNAVCIQNVKSNSSLIQFSIENGRILPLHLGASGKCILAFESGKVAQRIFETIEDAEDRARLKAELEAARAHQYIITKGEVDPDVFAIAAPITDGHAQAVASLSVAGPSFRCSPEREGFIIEAVKQAAVELSRRMGAGH
ncbi:IclR family transcriptional regulator [Paenibacillus rhizophilus]|uniref:IclR family transcriptional regulator n=1 Tax=Paenibacillus rhizophilus TaxID=1850366 RepID=A0A3N9PTH6_9BACL|nr:IclR family transcriptional regulator [Paenibacillus rhizophilus]RQW09702.1 IclR family transcriptional regulator [Paenibacillus rhizophilus]